MVQLWVSLFSSIVPNVFFRAEIPYWTPAPFAPSHVSFLLQSDTFAAEGYTHIAQSRWTVEARSTAPVTSHHR